MRYTFIFVLLILFFRSKGQDGSFASKKLVSSHMSIVPFVSEKGKIFQFFSHTSFLISVHRNIYVGLYYGHVSQRIDYWDKQSSEIFHRGGIIGRYKHDFEGTKVSIIGDLALAYSSFSIDQEEDYFIRESSLQIGVNGLLTYRIYSSLNLSGGFVAHRRLNKVSYGLEAVPMVGFHVQF